MDERLCGELLRAAQAADQEGIGRAVAALDPALRNHVRALCQGPMGRLRARARVTWEDVAQEVAIKVLRAPPSGSEDRPPVATVKRWVERTSKNHLIDLKRRKSERLAVGAHEPENPMFATEAEATVAELTAEHLERAHRRLLQACYPRGLALYDVALEERDDNDERLASDLGTTVNNIQACRTRMRKYLKARDHLEQKPFANPEDVAVSMGAPLNQETQNIIAKVRHHLALEHGGNA